MSEMIDKKVAIVLLNWNGWRDTIDCILSILCSDYHNFHIIVCDAASTDGSIDNILKWASGQDSIDFLETSRNKSCRVRFPIEVNRIPANSNSSTSQIKPDCQLTIIGLGENLGYAGGNNVGLRFALQSKDYDYFWVLNNDTIVLPDALGYLIARMEADPKIGLCGSTLLYYDDPQQVQTLGGSRYNRWLALAKYIQPPSGRYDAATISQKDVECQLDMIHGASIFIRKAFLDEVGLMSEDYFLFSEEVDWATRAAGRFRLAYAPQSIVFHKRGKATGNEKDPRSRSKLTDYYNIRSRLLYTKKYHPEALPTVIIGVIGAAFNRLRRGQFDRVQMIFRIIYDVVLNMEPSKMPPNW